MHKNEIKICLLLLVTLMLTAFCASKVKKINELKKREFLALEQQEKVKKLAEKISDLSLEITKSKDKINETKVSIKALISNIAKKTYIKETKIKTSSSKKKYYQLTDLEIRISAVRESDIYRFIFNIWKELNISFDKIQIVKTGTRKFAAKINCHCYFFDIKTRVIDFIPTTSLLSLDKKQLKDILLFEKDEEIKSHNVHAIIDRVKVYINDSWKEVGDKIDEYEVKAISADTITLQREDEDSFDVKLGGSW